jgi:U4/U6 small nuclear ribonucleoprotein PRP31
MSFYSRTHSLTVVLSLFSVRPDLTTKKRRGGKRIRRLKERFEETELMKQANKRAFSVEAGEYGDDAMGITLGMLDTKEGGAMRNTTEKRKMRQANTKASRKRAAQMSSGVTDGLASSVVFTPTQGMELVNPDANKERVRKANEKWFSDHAGFQSALPKK